MRVRTLSADELRPSSGACPGAYRVALEQVPDRRNRPHRDEGALVVPGADTRVEDRVRQDEEQLDGAVEVGLAVAVLVPMRHELGEQVPVPRGAVRTSARRPSTRRSPCS